MKKFTVNCVLSLTLLLSSCGGGSGDSGISPNPVVDTPVVVNPPVDNTMPPNTATKPCDFSLSTATVGDTLIIDCVLDLQNQSVSLPSNVTLEFDKGDIINGSINFASMGKIDGRLMNSSLEITGEANLIESTFKFWPSRWEIQEGQVTNEVALLNRMHMNKSIETIERLNGNIFELDKIDAFFNVEANKVDRVYLSERSIRIPSNFHFKMSDDTFLRVQPTNYPAYALLTTYLTDNATISGGNLVGDRWDHDYTPIFDVAGVDRSEHGWGSLIFVIGSHFTKIQATNTSLSTGEGIIVHAETIRNSDGTLRPGTRTSENVLIENCMVSENRRNGIAVIDADGVTIDNCSIIDTGQGEQAFDADGKRIFSSSGTAPKYGIDLEANRFTNPDGSLNESNKIENVFIKNSNFTGNEAGDIDIFTASHVFIENNFFDKWVASFASHDVLIENNEFTARTPDISFGISVNTRVSDITGQELNYNYLITGNTITGYRDGIKLAGINQTVSNNKINDCITGLQLGKLADSEIYGNEYISKNLAVSYGINPFPGREINNVILRNEYIEVTNRPLNFRSVNDDSTLTTHQITIENSELYTSSPNNFRVYFIDSKNILLKNNRMNTNVETINSTNITEEGSVIVTN